MAVAMVKASLVVGYFMHLKYDTRFNSLIFFGSLSVPGDLLRADQHRPGHRGDLLEEQDTLFKRQEESTAKRLEGKKKAAPKAKPPHSTAD